MFYHNSKQKAPLIIKNIVHHNMPDGNHKTVTVNIETYKVISELAHKENRSMCNLLDTKFRGISNQVEYELTR